MLSNVKRVTEAPRDVPPADRVHDARKLSDGKWAMMREPQRPRGPSFFALHAFAERVTWLR